MYPHFVGKSLSLSLFTRITFPDALREWIADVLTGTVADGIVIKDLAVSVQAAQAWARIAALLIDASEMNRTLRADEALRTTMRRRALVSRTARAYRTIVHHTANAVRTAR